MYVIVPVIVDVHVNGTVPVIVDVIVNVDVDVIVNVDVIVSGGAACVSLAPDRSSLRPRRTALPRPTRARSPLLPPA